jgi:proline-specific peptidase
MPLTRRVTVRGRRTFEYIAQGKGPATLLIHPGGPGYTYHYLRPLMRLANANLRVILYNPRGVGHSWSPARPSAYTVGNLAEDVDALRAALDIDELHLLGFSAGGFVALEYAHRFEEELTSLLLCDSAGSTEELRQAMRLMVSKATPKQRQQLAEFEKARMFHTPEYKALVERIWAPFNTRFLASGNPELKATKLSQAVYRAMLSRTGNEFVVDGTLARWDGRKYYAKIEVPTLVLVGRYDFFLDASMEMAERIVPAHLRVLPRASHYAHLEQPREFLNAVREFIADVTGE